MPPRPQPGMQTTATITAVYPIRGQRSRPHKTMRHLPRIAPSNMPQTTKSSADRHVRWLETSTKCSKHTVHQLCLTGRSQAENSRHSNKLTAKRLRLPDRGRSPRAPPRVHFSPPTRPAKDDRNQVPHAKKGNTSHSGRSKAQRETPDHYGSHFPGSGTNVGHYKQLSTQRPGSPQEHDSTTRRLSSVYPRQATHVLFTKNGPIESECKLNNVNPRIIRNQIQNQIEVTLNEDKYCKSCHYHTNTEF